jgi:hypothetical protein
VVAVSVYHQLEAAGEAKLAKDRRKMVARRCLGDMQLIANQLVRQALAYQGNYLTLAGRK